MRAPTLLVLTASLALPACGGGGGGDGGPPLASLAGRVTLPAFGSSLADGAAFDGDAFHARDLGEVRPAAAGRPFVVDGRIGPADVDALDVLRLRLPAGRFAFRLDTEDVLAGLHVIDEPTGLLGAHRDDGREVVVEIAAAATVDVAVDAVRGAGAYRLSIATTAAPPDATLPPAPGAPPLRTPAHARYLGAHHPMVPGEVVVLLEASAPRPTEVDFAAAGLTAVAAQPMPVDGDDLRVLRVAGALAAARAAGAAFDQSLEVETCLAARRASALPGVRAAAPNYLRTASTRRPNDQFYALQWHYQLIGMEQAWDITTGSSNVVVAVADTGVLLAHPDLSGRLIAGFDFISDPANARDGDGRDPNPDDPGDLASFPNSSWHGTHVAGTIGARTDDGTGVAGMDWECRLMPLRVLGVNGGSSADIVEAVRFAAGLPNASGTTPAVPRGRADVLNMSLGGAGGSAVEQAIYADARAAGLLVVCAAGNDGTTEPQFPASYPTNLSVGAVRFDKTRTSYSNRATTVDVMAPGGDVSVDQNGDNFGDGVLSCSAQADRTPVFVFEMGTSMACPHVAGLASLLYAVRPAATPADIERLILQNTEDLGAPGVDPVFQNGLIDPVAALRAATSQSPTGPILSANPIGLSLDAATSTARIDLANVGDTSPGAAVLDVVGVDVVAGSTPWLAASLDPAANPSASKISHDGVDLTVNRTGLSTGRHTGTVSVRASNASPVTVTVAIEVGTTGPTDTVFVLLVELRTVEGQIDPITIAQSDTDALRNFAWSLPGAGGDPIPDGAFLLVAGTDRDEDNFIGDDGELFGVWPIGDSPELVVISPTQRTLSGLEFGLAEIKQISSVLRRGYRRLR